MFFMGEKTMYCTKCGKQIPDDSVFCPKCGQAVTHVAEQADDGLQIIDDLSRPDTTMELPDNSVKKDRSSIAPFILIPALVAGGVAVAITIFLIVPGKTKGTDDVAAVEASVTETAMEENASVDAARDTIVADTAGTIETRNDNTGESEPVSSDSGPAITTVYDYRTPAAAFASAGDTDVDSSLYDTEYLVPDSDTIVYDRSFFKDFSAEDLRLARNEIVAKHGRIFKDEALQAYFESKSWYNGIYDPDTFDRNYGNCFNKIEQKNIDLIKELEAEYK